MINHLNACSRAVAWLVDISCDQLVINCVKYCRLGQGFKKPGFFKRSPTQRAFWVLTGSVKLWVFWVFPIDKWVVPSRDSLDRMHLALLSALLVVSFVV